MVNKKQTLKNKKPNLLLNKQTSSNNKQTSQNEKFFPADQQISKQGSIRVVFIIFLMIVLIVLLLFLLYFIYNNIPGKPENLEIDIVEVNLLKTPTNQFFSNMKFNHNDISYSIDQLCSQNKIKRVLMAFDDISQKVPSIKFYKNNFSPDIEVSCSLQEKESSKEDFFIAGEGGAKEIIRTGDYHIITNGVILLYEESNNIKKCDWPNIEIHELIHVFGFNHSQDKNNLMYTTLISCDQELDGSIINKLNQLYSQENLVELHFEDVNVTKKGRYLDFNVTIKNSGTIDSKNVTLSVIDNGEIVETRDIGDIKYGAGINLQIQNLKMIHRNPKEILFVINKENKIKEENTENNILKII